GGHPPGGHAVVTGEHDDARTIQSSRGNLALAGGDETTDILQARQGTRGFDQGVLILPGVCQNLLVGKFHTRKQFCRNHHTILKYCPQPITTVSTLVAAPRPRAPPSRKPWRAAG